MFRYFLIFPKCRFLARTLFYACSVTFWVLPKAGIFSTKVQSKNECWTLYKRPIEAVQPRFWQYLVSGSGFICQFFLVLFVFHIIHIKSVCLTVVFNFKQFKTLLFIEFVRNLWSSISIFLNTINLVKYVNSVLQLFCPQRYSLIVSMKYVPTNFVQPNSFFFIQQSFDV